MRKIILQTTIHTFTFLRHITYFFCSDQCSVRRSFRVPRRGCLLQLQDVGVPGLRDRLHHQLAGGLHLSQDHRRHRVPRARHARLLHGGVQRARQEEEASGQQQQPHLLRPDQD